MHRPTFPELRHCNTGALVAEMVATLYDESLDAFAPLGWPQRFSVFREDYSTLQSQFANTPMGFQHVFGSWGRSTRA